MDITLSCVSSSPPNSFICQLYDNLPQLDVLMDKIAAYVASLEPAANSDNFTRPGDPILAKFSEDQLWYRAQVLHSGNGEEDIEVLFVDYGNTGFVSVQDTLAIPHHFTSLHKQAITCQLDPKIEEQHLEAVLKECDSFSAKIVAVQGDCVVIAVASEQLSS